MEVNGKERQAEVEAKVVWREAPSWERTNIARNLFINPEDKEFKETIKNARKKLETSVAPAMPCKIMKICGSGGSNKIKKNLRVFQKLMNPEECGWESHYQIIMKTILQEKVTVHNSITIWFTNLFLCLKLWKFLQQKQRWRRNGQNWIKIWAWNLTKVRSRKEVIDEARTSGAKIHFASLMDTCHLKNAEFETKHRKYEGRVVPRSDIAKDDSGSYAVFTEQRSSASQMNSRQDHG